MNLVSLLSIEFRSARTRDELEVVLLEKPTQVPIKICLDRPRLLAQYSADPFRRRTTEV
jgi:hypothetical protein